ncbi:putative membrane protein [Thermodesulfobium acidiphilum]|uniref:Putative membrane protein n=1 Tax=Thermodesulfobium acidiphilum TaxID=1794699 RepID=A0A2R4W2G7_THEAF|nr:putative membrane protein [Thermodesulfobium acidiphilum]
MLYKESQVKPFYNLAAEYGIKKSDVGVPFMIIGNRVLIGTDEIKKDLPDLIQDGINHGGIPFPERVLHSEFSKYVDINIIENENSEGKPFAIFTFFFLVIVSSYSILTFKFKNLTKYAIFLKYIKKFLTLVFILIGLLISIYLFHLETTNSSGVCILFSGCNTVQRSSFSHIFGIIPLALLEILLFISLFGFWINSFILKRDKIFYFDLNKIVFWITFLAVIVAIYLTILEIFIVKAACVYCLISSIILGLLLILFNPNFDRINN